MKAHFILYVSDQKASARFYERVLAMRPQLDVPGMTEFRLNDVCVLGLMPVVGIKRLLGDRVFLKLMHQKKIYTVRRMRILIF